MWTTKYIILFVKRTTYFRNDSTIISYALSALDRITDLSFDNFLFTFFLGFLINLLECSSSELKLQQNWVFSMLIEMGVPIASLLITYSILINAKVDSIFMIIIFKKKQNTKNIPVSVIQ